MEFNFMWGLRESLDRMSMLRQQPGGKEDSNMGVVDVWF